MRKFIDKQEGEIEDLEQTKRKKEKEVSMLKESIHPLKMEISKARILKSAK